MTNEAEELQEFIGKEVVLDSSSYYLYIGTLEKVSEHFFVLSQVDVHDSRESAASKEVYILEARRHGIKANRKQTTVFRKDVGSVSLLSDILEF